MPMNRHWFLTSTLYGNWLPGDPRGSVTRVHNDPGERIEHDHVYESFEPPMSGLESKARSLLKGPIVRIDLDHAKVLLAQFQETATIREWFLIGVAIMAQHVHWLVGVNGDPDPEVLLRDFKGYGSRALNKRWSKPESGTWWTEGGSKRKVKAREGIDERVRYLIDQPFALIVWIHPDFAPVNGVQRGI